MHLVKRWSGLLCGFMLGACALTTGTACVPGTEVGIRLSRSQDAAFAGPGALKVVVRQENSVTPEVFGPYAVDKSAPQRLSTTVVGGIRFYVDVWACPSVDACTAEDRVGRGCSGIERAITGQTVNLEITLFDEDTNAAALCPPPF
jgi:hypothetical protein